jgi:hypothetical protein
MNKKILIISIIVFIIFVILGIILIFNYFRNNKNINNVISEENQKININNVISEENQKININNVISEENHKNNINNTSTSNIIKEESKTESKINSEANIEISTSGNAQIIPINNDTKQLTPNNVNLISEVKTQVPEIKSEPLTPINFVIKAGSTPAYTKNSNVRGYCKDFYSTWHQFGGLSICASCKDELGSYKHSCIVQCKGNYKNNNGKLDCE